MNKKQFDTNLKNEQTRRRFLDRALMSVAGGAALIVAGSKQAVAKTSQAAAKYQFSPRSGGHCFICKHYQGGWEMFAHFRDRQ